MLVPDFSIHGPGALAHSRILEQVAERRIALGFGLTSIEAGAVLIAPASCDLLGKRGWLIAGGKVRRAQVVDCENGEHQGQMASRGLLADVNEAELSHQEGWLILR